MSVPLPAFRRVRLTQQCVIHPQDKGGNYLPCASEDWVLFVSLAADEEKIILRTEHRCLPIEPGSALLLPPNVCHELPFVQAPCLMLEFSAADDGQAMFEFPHIISSELFVRTNPSVASVASTAESTKSEVKF